MELMKSKYQIEELPEVCKYIADLRTTRQSEIAIHKDDCIGIRYDPEKTNINKFDYLIKDTARIRDYLESTSLPERLKFYRDATYHYILTKDHDNDIKKIVIGALKTDGFDREAGVLKKKY
jgi:hypothetical protein